MSKSKIRFVFTLEEGSLEMKLCQYLKSGSSSREKFFEAVLAYHLPLVLSEDNASNQAILDAVEDSCYSLDKRSEYMRRRFPRIEKTPDSTRIYTTLPSAPDPDPTSDLAPAFNDEELY